PRFDPVSEDELDELDIEVSVLEPPERVEGLDALDPSTFGVVVTSGDRRGVLLPDVSGIDTAEEQVRIACRKAGIDPAGDVALSRFTVRKDRQP
ncbi:MAG: AMMECR1 domain-containing protein, partial [Myxococcota bacterium]|nr:AMMECR1 domain-containing protein [Myxococcota bacterium]